MAPFEALYGCKCRTPVSWNRLEDRIIVRPEMLQEMEEQVLQIWQRLKEENDRQKSYADAKRTPREFLLGDKVLLRVKPQKSTIKFGKNAKLALRYVGPFEVLEVVNPVAYRIALPPALARMTSSMCLIFKSILPTMNIWLIGNYYRCESQEW